MFAPQPSKPDLWLIQQSISTYWKSNCIFEKSIEQRSTDNPYRFYDGPPFVTGLPHYGHLASSVAKDVIPRFQAMRGKRVDRVWGWDCHGIPIEQKVQDKLWLSSNAEIEKVGKECFIEGCYDFTRNTSEEWQWYVDNFGRWVDFDGSYKTMDNNYMESTRWVFKQIWEKGLIYKGKRVSLYSTKLETPISNFEVAMDDSYSEVNDPAITVKFGIKEGEYAGMFFLAWTTTPWTIPAHIALGVNNDLTYVVVTSEDEKYIVAKARAEDVFKGKEYEIVSEMKGEELVGIAYEPPFDYYVDVEGKKHVVIHAEFATDESGTGIVHQAPEFGEDDFNLGKAEGLHITEAMNSRGEYTDEVTDYAGMFYRDANPAITDRLGESGKLFAKASITHRVAHCPRTHMPLVYKAQDSWFIDIQSIKDRLLAANEQINWYPGHFKKGRFAKSIETAPDRCISRNRYWGTPMPVYAPEEQVKEQNVQAEDVLVMGSRDELWERQQKGSDNVTKFHFIRHGESTKNVEGWQDCRGVSPLTDNGQAQAQDVAKQLADVKGATIYISPMPRAFQTILPYLTDVLGHDERMLQEKFDAQLAVFHKLYDSGELFEFVVEEEVELRYELTEGVYVDWRITEAFATANNGPDAPRVACNDLNRYDWNSPISPDGWFEKMELLTSRLTSFAQSVANDGEVVVVSHADPLVALRAVLAKQGEEGYRGFRTKHLPKKGSVASLYYLSSRGVELDMHVPYIDDVWFAVDGQRYVRIPDVLDCWMESGSMPYWQMHYPFENKEAMEASFPADYVVEYTGQIRAWFYVMHVLGVILFDKPAYTNVICHGVVSGNDGRKMSKSLGNFPDPKPTFQQYGGDAIRMSILTSPLFNAGDTAITEEGIGDALRGYVLPLWNAFSFFTTYANIDQWAPTDIVSENVLDQWIVGELNALTASVTEDLETYDLQHSSRALGEFLDNLTNWYIRRSRRRFWKTESSADKNMAYQTLYDVLLGFCQIAAPFMPFLTEYMWRSLKGDAIDNSVHLTDWPVAPERDEDLTRDMGLAQQIVTMGLAWRSQHDLRVRQPLSTLTLGVEISDYYQAIIREELNIKSVICDLWLNDEVTKIVKPDGKKIGPKFGKNVKTIFGEAKSGNFIEQTDGSVLVAGEFVLEAGEYEISYIKKDPTKDVVVDQGIVMSADATITPELELEGYVRDMVRAIQDARKEADYDIADRIELSLSGDLTDSMRSQFGEYIEQETLSTIVDSLAGVDIEKEIELGGGVIVFGLKK